MNKPLDVPVFARLVDLEGNEAPARRKGRRTKAPLSIDLGDGERVARTAGGWTLYDNLGGSRRLTWFERRLVAAAYDAGLARGK